MLELAPDEADHHDTLARILRRAGRLEEAEAEARRATDLAPDNADHHDTLAFVLWQADRLRYDPDAAYAQHRAGPWSVQLGDTAWT